MTNKLNIDNGLQTQWTEGQLITAKDSLRLKDLPARLGGSNEAPTFSRQVCCTEHLIVFILMGISLKKVGV